MLSEDGQQHLGEYLVKSVLSERGNTRVYLARDEPLNKLVVLKRCQVLTPDDHDHIERLFQGARAVASLDHPNVVKLHAVRGNPESGDCYAVMEYANGGSVADLVKKEGRLSLEKALDIAIQVCTALDYIHRRRNIVHGNIKPSNILLFYDGDQMVAKIADFGLSERAADGQVDLNALGLVLYNMLVGTPPSGDGAPPQKLRPAVFDELNELVLTALAKSPSKQFQDAEAMLNDLQEARKLCEKYHDQAEKLYNQGVRYQEQGKWKEAIKAFKEAYSLAPEMRDVEQRLENARVQLELERLWHEMEELWTGDDWDGVLAQLERIRALDPMYREREVRKRTEDAQSELRLASLYRDVQNAMAEGLTQQAIDFCRQILNINPRYKDVARILDDLRKEEELEELRKQGEELVGQKKWGEAVSIYGQILTQRPDDPGATRQQAYAQYRLDLARQLIQAQVECEAGNLDNGIKILEDIISSEPNHEEAKALHAEALRRRRMGQLREKAERAIEERLWAEAEKALKDLRHIDPDDEWVKRQLEHVKQWQVFDNLYRLGMRDLEAHQWDEAVAKLDKALTVAEEADLDLYNYRDIRPSLDKAKTQQQLDALKVQRKQHETDGNLPALIEVLDQMGSLDPENEEVQEWRRSALQRDLRSRFVRRADPIRRWGLPVVMVLGVVLLLIFVLRLAEVPPVFSRLVVTWDFVGAVVSIFALFVGFIGLLVPTEKLFDWLRKDKRLIVCAILVMLLTAACLLVLMIRAFVIDNAPDLTPSPIPTTLAPAVTETITPTVTRESVLLESVIPLEPENGSCLDYGLEVTLRWSCPYALEAKEYYRLRLQPKGQDVSHVYYTKENFFDPPILSSGIYSCAVAVVRYLGQDNYEPVSEESGSYSFQIAPPEPLVHTISPTNTVQGAPAPVVVIGENFTQSIALTIDVPLLPTVVNSSTIEAIVPMTLEVGEHQVVVKGSCGKGESSAFFTVQEPPTATPTMLPRTPTPRPPVYLPPVLDFGGIIGCDVTFRWQLDGTLAEKDYFAVRVGRMSNPPRAQTWTKELQYTYVLTTTGDYTWQVAICRGDPADEHCHKGDNELTASELGAFSFGGCTQRSNNIDDTPPCHGPKCD